MATLSNLIQTIEPSPTLAAVARAKTLAAQGRDIIAFTAGEPDFDTPDHVKQAAVKALNAGKTKYTPVGGIPELKNVLIEKFKRDQGLTFRADEIVVTNGGKQSLAAAMAVLLNPGDEVIIPAPYWTSYPDMTKLVGGVPVIVQTTAESGYVMSAEQLRSHCSERTRIIIINSPSNPTGACYDATQLKAIVEVVKKLPNRDKITIISDEVYEYITFDGVKHESIAALAPELREQILISNAFSKAYSMTGWRVGYAAGPADIVTAMHTHQSQFTSNICSIAQYAAAAAYEDNYAFPKLLATEFAKRIDKVYEVIKDTSGLDLPIKPKGAFYAFIRTDNLVGKSQGKYTIKSGTDFANYLLEEFDTVVVAGEAFGEPHAFRISFAMDMKELSRGLDRIKQAAQSLR